MRAFSSSYAQHTHLHTCVQNFAHSLTQLDYCFHNAHYILRILHSQKYCRLIDAKNARRYDDCLKYTMVSGKKALRQAGLEKVRQLHAPSLTLFCL